jgi:hypothetical protein|tara:strand:+ start:6451 stop:6903 length:453 start_codon:yes stop_codon:yes gene_type:complete
MATTNSTQYANTQATPRVMNATHEDRGRVRVKAFSWTQVGTGTAADQQYLCQMEAGAVRILAVSVAHSAFGTSRTLDFGHTGATDPDGAAIAADPDAFSANLAVASAGTSVIDINTYISTKDGFVFAGQVNDGTQPAAATLTGYVTYVID